MGQHDLSYRLFFSHARMVCDLLREMIGETWVELIDFASAERVNASFASETRRNRESDVIWKFRRRDSGAPVYVYLLLEFQSRPDRYMPVRLMTYTGLFYENLVAEGRLAPSGRLPQSPVADLFRLEGSASWNDVLVGVKRLEEHVKLDEEPELYRAFVGWLREVIFPRLGAAPDEIPQGLTFKEFRAMLAERIESWNEQQLQRGRKEGEAETLLLLLETRFGPVDQATRDRIATADADHLLKWIKRFATAESLADVFSS